MAEQDPNSQEDRANEPTPYVTAEMAWEMSKRAAAEARAEAIKDTQVQMRNSGNVRDNRYDQDTRETQNNRYPQDNRDYRRDRDDDYEERGSRRRKRRDEEEDEEDLVGFSPKLIKQLQTTVGVFNTLKDFSSNPMQKAIEDRIGGLAAGIIENAFSTPRGPAPKRDMIDTLLNSQMAFGIGQGLGSRAPELVETLSKSFGKEKAENMIEGMIGKYSGRDSGREPRKIESGERDRVEPSEPARPSPMPQKSEDQSNIELLLSLDPNNPEHVAAYSESQGGISIDVSRKMLMIHQDDIIKRMKSQGADTTVIESQRGSRVGQDNPSQRPKMDQDIDQISEPRPSSSVHTVNVAPDYQTPPVQQVPHVQQPPPAQRIEPAVQTPPIQQPPPVKKENPTMVPHEDSIQEDMQYVEPSIENFSEDYQKQDQEYAEYKDVGKDRPQERNTDRNLSNNQQAEIMKAFADDIGKVMGDVIGKIEGLNNTVFSLQTELNEIKKQKAQPSPVQPLEQKPLQQQRPIQEPFREEVREPMHIQDSFQERIQEPIHIQDSFPEEMQQKRPIQDFFPEDTQEPEHILNSFPEEIQQQRPIQDFFPEETQKPDHIQDSFPEKTQKPDRVQDSFQERTQKPEHIQDSSPEETQKSEYVQESSQKRVQKPRFARDFFPDDSEREPEETRYDKNMLPETVQDVDRPKPETQDTNDQRPKVQDVKVPKPKVVDMENFFQEKAQNIHDFERELEEETKRATQSMKKANADKIPEADIENKEIEIVKKPIISIVNKKRVRFLPKQKGDSVQSRNKDKDIKEDNNNIKNSVNNENGENSNSENSDTDKSGKDDTHDDIDKNNAE